MIPETHTDLLGATGFAHVATNGRDGAPQSNPVWYDWDGKRLLLSQTTTRQKLKNPQRDPRVAVSIVDPENPYRYLELRGEVVEVEPDPDKAFIERTSS